MLLIIRIHLFKKLYTICQISTDYIYISKKNLEELGIYSYQPIGEIEHSDSKPKKGLKLVTNALFLQPFIKECVNSKVYRVNVLKHMIKLTDYPLNMIVSLKLIMEPPDKEIIDYLWNEKILKLVWSRVEIENAFSWLSTLGGAYSALGDYFDYCAEEAGRISIRQYKLSRLLGDESLAARSRLYSALAYAQKNKLKLSRHIVRDVAEFAQKTHDRRLVCMCQGVWAKLKYLRQIRKNKLKAIGDGNGRVLEVKYGN